MPVSTLAASIVSSISGPPHPDDVRAVEPADQRPRTVCRPQKCSTANSTVVRLGSAVHHSTVGCVPMRVLLIASPSRIAQSIPGATAISLPCSASSTAVARGFSGFRGQRAVDGYDDRGHRDRQVRAGDPEERAASGDREQDHRRVELDAAALDHRLQERALGELHHEDEGENRERELPSSVREADEHGDEAETNAPT